MHSKNNHQKTIENIYTYNLNYNTREIFVTPEDNENNEVNSLIATQFVKNLIFLNHINHDPVIVHLGIGGGDWTYGMMMFDTMLNSPSKIIAIGYGQIQSIASVILQAAHLRLLMPNCEFMIHEGYYAVESHNVRGGKTHGDWNTYLVEVMLDIYINKCQKSTIFDQWPKYKIREFFMKQIKDKEDWYMTAQDAVYYGFADGIFGAENFINIENIINNLI